MAYIIIMSVLLFGDALHIIYAWLTLIHKSCNLVNEC